MDSPYHHPIAIRLEPEEGEPINGEEMFVARCEHFPELAMAEGSPGKAYDGLMAMIEKVWATVKPESKHERAFVRCKQQAKKAAWFETSGQFYWGGDNKLLTRSNATDVRGELREVRLNNARCARASLWPVSQIKGYK